MNITKEIEAIIAMGELEIRRVIHDPFEAITRAIQPILWIVIFGSVMARIKAFGVADYITFITPGVILQSATMIALSYGIMLVFERESGILKRLVSSPINRISLIIGRAFAGATRAAFQYIIILLIAIPIGAKIVLNPINLVVGYIVLTLGSMGFTAISIFIASILKKRERFMGIIGAITMPLFFASNALYPLDVMPEAIKDFAIVNPLTYMVSALRLLLIQNSFTIINDIFALGLFTIISVLLASKFLQRIVE